MSDNIIQLNQNAIHTELKGYRQEFCANLILDKSA